MIGKIFKLIVVGILLFVLFLPVKNFIKRTVSENDLQREERETIGTVHGSNPRVKEIQTILRELGLYDGAIDGIIGRRTRSAITEFQQSHKLSATGFVNSKTLAVLNRKSAGNERNSSTETSRAEPDPEDRKRIMKIQEALAQEGFYEGKIDGKLGRRTKQAIKEFQQSRGLKPDGVVGPKTWMDLTQINDN